MGRSLLALLAASLVLCSCGGGQKTEEANATLSRLARAAEDGKYMYAHQDDLCYGHFWHDSLGLSDVKAVCGDYPAIVGFDLGGLELGAEANLDGVDFSYMHSAAIEHVNRGGIVTFSWHPRNPLTGGDAWDVSGGKVVSAILPGGELNTKYMDWLSKLADFLGELKDADGKPVEAIFRPWHENIGGWFWWGAPYCSSDEYKALWTMTRDYMVNVRGLKSLVWAYSPNAGITAKEYMSTYPGDEQVDVLGLDAYQYSSGEEYVSQLEIQLTCLDSLASAHGKISALTEAGYEGIADEFWWTGTLDNGLAGHKLAYVLTWRNAWDKPEHFYGPWPGAECEEDFRSFYKLDNTLFLKDIQW